MTGLSPQVPVVKQDGREIEVVELGLCPYKDAWELQKLLHQELISGRGSERIITCEHPPVITCGKSTKTGNLLIDESALSAKGFELFRIERGGDITCHEPGQLVVYPILDLNRRKRDVSWYMRLLEKIIIETLADFSVEANQISGKTGVWIDAHTKIASIGVRLSRWCSMHGLALNVCNDLTGFSLINPCGFTDIKMTSLSKELGRTGESVEVEDVRRKLLAHMQGLLGGA